MVGLGEGVTTDTTSGTSVQYLILQHGSCGSTFKVHSEPSSGKMGHLVEQIGEKSVVN